MIESKSTLTGNINAAQTISGALNNSVEYRYPELENLEVNPSAEKQVFNHPNSYGYDEVVVKGVTSEVDENIKPENIKGGVEILGVTGNIEFIDYWSTELSSVTSNEFNLKNYVKELPKYLNISNWPNGLSFGSLSLEKADLRLWDLSNVTYINFASAKNLKELNMSGCRIDKMTSLSNLCYYCTSLEKVDLKEIDTSKITNLSSMFFSSENLTSLDLSDFDTSNVTNMQMMFYNCKKLKYLDIRSFVFDKVTAFYGSMFGNIPADCLIIVKDETAKSWVLARRSDLTNVKTVAELVE